MAANPSSPISAGQVPKGPLLLLDIDGVINFPYNDTAEKMWPDHKHVEVKAPTGQPFTITFSPSMIATINKWATCAEVRWLTSWNEGAQTELAPALGLSHFELARTSAEERDYANPVSKAQAGLQAAAAEPSDHLVVWIDDDLASMVRDDDPLRTRPNTLLIAPTYGITPEQVQIVDNFLSDPTLWRGKSKLVFQRDTDYENARLSRGK